MKTLLIFFTLLSQIAIAADECPFLQTCLTNPTYNGYGFLANTSDELGYASYASHPNDISNPEISKNQSSLRRQRAHSVCKFLGHGHATFAKFKMTFDDLLDVDNSGFAEVASVTEASYPAPNAAFEKLNCK